MDIDPGPVDYSIVNDKGEKISKIAAEHMAQYRVRCWKCSKIFCSKCSYSPYHVGYTCSEFEEHKESAKCRFCQSPIEGDRKIENHVLRNVCENPECVEFMNNSCNKKLECGHYCYGFKNEKVCLPCLDEMCVKKNPNATLNMNSDSFCIICFTTGLGNAPSLKLNCGHIFHVHCILKKLIKRFPGPRITFGFADCPTCKKPIECNSNDEIQKEILNVKNLYNVVKDMAIKRISYEGLYKDARLKDPKDRYYNKLEEYALARLSYYMCFKCKKPYFGGLKSCDNVNEGNGEMFKEEELVCGKCAAVNVSSGIMECNVHGKEFIEFKCKFCCSIAQWFCWGTTHFCETCHQKQVKGGNIANKKKNELPQCQNVSSCPLKLKHPPNGEEFSLGCAICRNSNENLKDF